jgi:hypothetical protein
MCWNSKMERGNGLRNVIFVQRDLMMIEYSILMFVLAVLNVPNSGNGDKEHIWSKQDKPPARAVALPLQQYGVDDNVYMSM